MLCIQVLTTTALPLLDTLSDNIRILSDKISCTVGFVNRFPRAPLAPLGCRTQGKAGTTVEPSENNLLNVLYIWFCHLVGTLNDNSRLVGIFPSESEGATAVLRFEDGFYDWRSVGQGFDLRSKPQKVACGFAFLIAGPSETVACMMVRYSPQTYQARDRQAYIAASPS